MNLRERKKERTQADLAEAAYAIAVESGMDALTADAIAARAGVSRRTFFNYYASVDAALCTAVAGFFASLTEVLENEPRDEPLWSVVARLVEAPTPPEPLRRITLLAAVGQSSPHARRIIDDLCQDWLGWLETHLAQRLPDADEAYVVGLTHAVVGAAQASISLWGRRTGGTLTPQSLALHRQLLAESLRFVRTGFEHR